MPEFGEGGGNNIQLGQIGGKLTKREGMLMKSSVHHFLSH